MAIKEILMKKEGYTEKEAEERIHEVTNEMNDRLTNGEISMDICEEYFGLEPDYLEELLF